MKTQAEICRDIRERAKHVGVSVSQVCRVADVDRKTFHRWQTGERDAIYSKLRDTEIAMQKLERVHVRSQKS